MIGWDPRDNRISAIGTADQLHLARALRKGNETTNKFSKADLDIFRTLGMEAARICEPGLQRKDAPNVMLAGGAVRDMLLNREVQDLDIYINKPSHNVDFPYILFEERVSAALNQPVKLTVSFLQNDPYSFNDPYGIGIHAIYNTNINGRAVQLIVTEHLHSITDYMGTFNASISQAHMLLDGTVHTSRAFIETLVTKVIKIYPDKRPIKQDYVKKLQGYFPDYEFDEDPCPF